MVISFGLHQLHFSYYYSLSEGLKPSSQKRLIDIRAIEVEQQIIEQEQWQQQNGMYPMGGGTPVMESPGGLQ